MDSGFNAMGKPIPFFRKEEAYQQAKQMGVSSEDSFAVVNAISLCLEKNQPYDAQKVGLKYLDLIGVYRLMAYLLTAENPEGNI